MRTLIYFTALLYVQVSVSSVFIGAEYLKRSSVFKGLLQERLKSHADRKMLVYADGNIRGTIGGGEMESRVIEEALGSLADGQPQLMTYSLVDPERGDPGICGGEVEVYIEPYHPPATVLIIGCGHVGRAVAHLANWLG